VSADYSDVFEDAFNLLCGERIGRGMARDVFISPLLPGCVIKVETRAHSWQNVIEWETWSIVKHNTPASRWFAECKWISPNGRVLVQERTRPPAPSEFVDRVPVWFTDLKRQNWGMAMADDNRTEYLVCHDYGTSLMLQDGTVTKRMRKADWWDAE
jgi:hypothetical protein